MFRQDLVSQAAAGHRLYNKSSDRRSALGKVFKPFMLKRSIDLLVALVGLLLLSPVILVLAVLVRLRLGGPVLFLQQRPGLRGKPFKMLKFRSMTDARGRDGAVLPDAQRLIPFGQWLRASSLDELPELWNVLLGDMSIIGPRPLLMEYLPLYSPTQARRHEVRPGITGWAQINGRNAISWDQKFDFDIWYVDNQSFLLDLKIFFLTFSRTARRSGITHKSEATMPRFRGSGQPRNEE